MFSIVTRNKPLARTHIIEICFTIAIYLTLQEEIVFRCFCDSSREQRLLVNSIAAFHLFVSIVVHVYMTTSNYCTMFLCFAKEILFFPF